MLADLRKLPVYFSFVVMAVVAVGLAACGDDDSDYSSRPDTGDAVLSFDDLTNCTAKKVGALEFVKDTPYVCVESDGKFKWEKVSQTEDEPEDFKVCNQKREGQYALSSNEDILYVCSDEEWTPLIQVNDDASSSSGKESGSSSSKSKSSDSGKDKGSSGSVSSSSDKGYSSDEGASSSSDKEAGSSSSASKSSDSGKEAESSSSVSSSSVSSSSAVSSTSTPSSFSTGMDESAYDSLQNTLTDYRDGQVYKTTTIEIFNEERGIRYSEVWMAQNLNYAYLVATSTLDSCSFCYDDQPAMCDEYGRYYTWAAAMDSAGVWSEETKGCGYIEQCFPTYPVRGVCPKGWHLPSDTEWEALIEAIDGARTSLFDRKNWLSVLPARAYGESAGPEAIFWSSKGSDSFKAYHVFVAFPDYIAVLSQSYKTKAFSVRCLKDDDVVPSSSSVTPKSSSSRRRVIESSSSVIQAVVDPSTVVTGTMTDERDGQTYGTVTIGEQTWMAQNLKFAYMVGTNPRDSSSLCYKNGLDKSCLDYGRYYTWASAMDSAGVWSTDGKGCGIKELCTPTLPVQGVCPSGWHLPSNYEWNVLLRAVDHVAMHLSGGNWNSSFGTNKYRFGALPGGYKREGENLIGDFVEGGSHAYFWTSAGFYIRIYMGNTVSLNESSGDEDRWYNVRCIKD